MLLAIDCGTQSIRAILFDHAGRILAKSQEALGPYQESRVGWVEQDPDYFWQRLCSVCQTLWSSSANLKNAVQAVALTTQRSTVVNLDKDGKPLRSAILWLDRRKTERVPPLSPYWRLLFSLLGVKRKIESLQQEAEINWIWAHQPEVWEKTERFCLLSSYLSYQLTGQYEDSVASQVGFLPFDYKKQKWAGDKDWRWQALAVKRHMLPTLVPPGRKLGEVTLKASSVTGIPVGVPVIAAGADKACEVIGSGCVDLHQGAISFGTTVTFNIPSSRYIEPFSFIPAYPAVIPATYTMEYQIYRGFWLIQWFKEQFATPEVELAKMKGVVPEIELEKEIETLPPGNGGLLLQPTWMPGLWFPPPEAKGAIVGFGEMHQRRHLYRAILEGLVYALREGKEFLEKRTGIPITELRVSGGGSQSKALNQITSDIFGLPVVIPETFETAGLGAACAAAVGVGLYSTFEEAIAKMVRVKEVKPFNSKAHETYDALYRQVYKKLYPALGKLYKAIQHIVLRPS